MQQKIVDAGTFMWVFLRLAWPDDHHANQHTLSAAGGLPVLARSPSRAASFSTCVAEHLQWRAAAVRFEVARTRKTSKKSETDMKQRTSLSWPVGFRQFPPQKRGVCSGVPTCSPWSSCNNSGCIRRCAAYPHARKQRCTTCPCDLAP